MFKVIIVDDEPMIRHGLVNFINWNSVECEVVGEAENGLEAIDIIKKQKPDIIVSDIKMPALDGLELSKYVYENHPAVKMIILTGYADFSYAQTAIKYGVVDFVLKPAFTEKIVEAVNKAKKILREQAAKEERVKALQNQANCGLGEMREKFILNVISQAISDKTQIKEKAETLQIIIERYFMLIFQIEENSERYKFESNEFMHSMKNFIALTFQDYRHYSTYMSKNLMCTVLDFDRSEEPDCIQIIMERCEEILDIVNNYVQFTISIGISRMHKGTETLPDAYKEACDALTDKFYDEENIFLYANHQKREYAQGICEINSHLNKIMLNIRAGQCEEAIAGMKALIEEEKDTRSAVDHATGLGINICAFCSNQLSNFNLSLEKVLKNGRGIYKQIVRCSSVSHLEEILTEVIRVSTDCLNSSQRMNNYIITMVKNYIASHYSENIKLNRIAEFVHVNSSYLSRMFKKETGETITEAINKLRIQKAKELLSNKNIKLYEVAAMVGINDSTYFSQVFKKYAGMSPTAYRYFNGE